MYGQIQELQSHLVDAALCRRRAHTEEEQMNVYRKIVSHYGEDNVVIKPHPRDKCDYKSFFSACGSVRQSGSHATVGTFRCGV